MKRALALVAVLLLALVLCYVSRFWIPVWGRPGLFGLEWLPPRGGQLAMWLRGTPLAPFELLIWALMVFGVLSAAQAVINRIAPDS